MSETMKSKNYWEKDGGEGNPFDLLKRIDAGIENCKRSLSEAEGCSGGLKYVWIYVTDEGIRPGGMPTTTGKQLELDEWLNVIDESASLGAEWMILYVGTSLSAFPGIWKMCDWAQRTHGLSVGLHLVNNCLSEDDFERLGQLEANKTVILANRDEVASLSFLEQQGIRVCDANIGEADRPTPCAQPEGMACVGPDGSLFSCGLVMGEDSYALGDSRGRNLEDVMHDEALPHAIDDQANHREHGCDACPPLIAERLRAQIQD